MFIRFGSESFYFFELCFGGKWAVLVSVGDDVASDSWGQTCDVLQECCTGSVHIDTDTIDDILDFFVELLVEQVLINIMLVLPYSNSFRIDFGKFC